MTPARAAVAAVSPSAIDQALGVDNCTILNIMKVVLEADSETLVTMYDQQRLGGNQGYPQIVAYAAEQVAQAREEEREACAKVADGERLCPEDEQYDNTRSVKIGEGTYFNQACQSIATTIRRRGEG
jgi:hypothetical protein